MDQGESLLQTVLARPGDVATRLVYADWLEEQSDHFAAYVRAEAQAEQSFSGSVEWAAALGRMAVLSRSGAAPLGGWRYELAVARIRPKVSRLRWALRDMGERSPDPLPVAEADLVAFEMRHGIALPAEYRAFLLRLGNETIGTGSGLIPLPLAGDIPELRSPFPNSPQVIQQLLEGIKWAIAHEGHLPPRVGGEIRVEMSTLGCLQLVTWGSSNETYLLGVNGPARGQVWTHGDWYNPLPNDQGSPHNFLSWYEEWLDKWADEELQIGEVD